jgi:hypothetical protein
MEDCSTFTTPVNAAYLLEKCKDLWGPESKDERVALRVAA